MPLPKKNEKQTEYISRCIKEVMNEGKTQEQALGKCYGMFKEYTKTNDAISVNGFESPEAGNLGEEGKRLLAKVYAECRKGQKSADKEKCAKVAWSAVEKAGFKQPVKDCTIFETIDKVLDGDCECDKINDEECAEIILDKFDKQDAEKVAKEFKLDFPLDDILEGLNVELEHKDITGGDLEETAKIVIVHLKERADYYKLLKKYVEVEDLDVLDEYTIGTVREWKGGKYKKIASGEWERVSENKTENHKEKSLKIENFENFRKAMTTKSQYFDLKLNNGTTIEDCRYSDHLNNYQGGATFSFEEDNESIKLDEDLYLVFINFEVELFSKKMKPQKILLNKLNNNENFKKYLKVLQTINDMDSNEFKKLQNEVDKIGFKAILNSKISSNINDYAILNIYFKDNFSIIYDAVSIHNKKATIMRDGYYKYLAREVDKQAKYPMDVVNVYRPPEEVKKAFAKFKDELKRLPVIANHPESDLDLKNPESFRYGEGIKPALRLENGNLLLDCELSNLKGKVKEFYDKGIKEISCGWHGEYEKVDDESLDYQYIQRFKDFNHIAVLERGRCGNTCSIKDTKIEKGVLDMTKEELEQLVDQKVNDKVAEILDNKQKEHEANETKKKEDEEEKRKSEGKKEETNEPKDDDIEDAYLNGDDDEDDLEKAKGKLKKFKDCFTKMKAKKTEVKDADIIAIYDKKIEDTKIAIRDAFVENSKGTYEALEMGIFGAKETIGKTPCEIKASVVKKVLDKEISINDMETLNAFFDIALKSFVNPKWNAKKVNDMGFGTIEELRKKSKEQLEIVARGEKLGGK
jgi:hypothetical protein